MFWIGLDEWIWTNAWDAGVGNGSWMNPSRMARPGVMRVDSPIAAVSRTPNRLDVFWIGPDGGIGSTGWEGGANNNAWEQDFSIARPGVARL